MNERGSLPAHTPFQLCIIAEEQDEALEEVMVLANLESECGLHAAFRALGEIHELVKSFLDT